jgi:hypothetical protein
MLHLQIVLILVLVLPACGDKAGHRECVAECAQASGECEGVPSAARTTAMKESPAVSPAWHMRLIA